MSHVHNLTPRAGGGPNTIPGQPQFPGITMNAPAADTTHCNNNGVCPGPVAQTAGKPFNPLAYIDQQIVALEAETAELESQAAKVSNIRARYEAACKALQAISQGDLGIPRIVAKCFKIPLWELLGTCKETGIVWPRMTAMYLERKLTKHTLQRIARHYPNGRGEPRDHGTVMHACRRVQERIDTEPKFAARVALLTEFIEHEHNAN